jgi:ABC-2 type transport system ATP-binding protein
VIDVVRLTKRYGDLLAVDDLSFSVGPGEILGLVGPNGAGKTTTLRSLVGIINPNAGTIRIGGHDLKKEPIEAKRTIAFVPDDPSFFDHLTVSEHLQFIARLYNVLDAGERAPRLLRRLELADRAESLPEELSRGMRQKLSIAMALLPRPRALLFDEPLSGLDPAGRRKMKETIRKEAEGGAAVILSSHQLQLVEELAPRVLVLSKGKGVAMGSLDEIIAHRPELEGRGLEDVFFALTGSADDDAAAEDLNP